MSDIDITAGTQIRVGALDAEHVQDLEQAILQGVVFAEPPVVFCEENRYILADGFHRYRAHKNVGSESMTCELKDGGKRAALAYALGANHANGLRRSNKDKRNAVATALLDSEWVGWANTKVARLCHVTEALVRIVRRELEEAGRIERQEMRRHDRAGTTVGRSRLRDSNRSNGREKDSKKRPLTKEQKKTSAQVRADVDRRRAKRRPKTQDDIHRERIRKLVDEVKAIPHDGGEAVRRWDAYDWFADLNFAIGFLREMVGECKSRSAFD